MRKELDEALCKDFPTVFKNRHGDILETCMAWGFECGDGWEPIIREAAAKIEAINKTLPENQHCVASQIKEKYGTLRFYLNSGTDEAYDATDEAERKSESICESCGSPGICRGRGWYYTACDACEALRK